MKVINQDEKAEFSGVLLTLDEFNDYKKLLKVVDKIKSMKDDYDMFFGGV